MDIQREKEPIIMQNYQHMNLVLSTDPKPRLKWTPELHQRFVDAVAHLGGAHKATPKSLMRAMGITGLTLYHLKSHLQKYRLGKTQKPENHSMNENMKRLHEQIEVQRHLQLRIEAQGKYLQRVLRRAQEMIAGYGCCSEALEEAKAELSELASMVSYGYQSDEVRETRMGSIDSSLTSLEEAPTVKTKKKKRKGNRDEEEQSSSVSEGDYKRFIDLNVEYV
ncbi:myb-related protein 1-like [Cucurbita moschata]|uniref:Myb-related protein 1-like n=1 Tax=Cucurbita moschata TaxID=3662 RepID=A0A6J1GAW5_CUCMO|nr:myb-related protein 1-like [Cucurbita moschata]